jgi:hypothetical protein
MGKVLRNELGRADLDMNQMRLTNLWLHPKTDSDECFTYGLEQVMKEAKGRKAILLIGSDTVSFKGRKAILLIGSDTVSFFCDEKVSEVNGLEVKSTYFSAPLLFACVQPATVFHQGLGELRLSLQKFSKRVNGL